jgi:cytoskeleton protein RodZ
MKKGPLMSEGNVPVDPEQSDAVVSQGPRTAGAMLRLARERQGLHVAALAVSMKVPVKKLEALESDRLDLLPDAVFVRALAGSVCRALQIDPRPVLDLLPVGQVPKLDVGERGINTPFSTPGTTNAFSITSLMAKPQSILVALILLAAVGVLLYPEAVKDEQVVEAVFPGVAIPASNVSLPSGMAQGATSVSAATAVAASAEVVPALTPVPSGQVTSPDAYASTGAVAPAKATVVAVPLVPVSTASSVKAPSAVASPLAMQPASSPSAVVGGPADIVMFKAAGSVWVQVKDSKGITLLSRTLVAGESVSVGGVAPLGVIVGRADLISVSVRGKDFNLSAVSQDNVARFEVK